MDVDDFLSQMEKALLAMQPLMEENVTHNRETNPDKKSYDEHHLTGDAALQDGDLETAEQHFASALKQVHDRQSPRLREEEECLRKLGEVYVRRGEQTKDGQDFAKATALYNAALARNGDKQLLIDFIKEAERLFLCHTVGIDCKPSSYENDIQHKDRLEKYRTEVKACLDTIHKNHNPYKYDEGDPLVKKVEKKRAEAVRDLFKEISEQRKGFIRNLVEKCIETIGPPPCQYAMVGLGSQATELVTPYSDLEFAILIEEDKDIPENKNYFLNLTCYLYLKIINLGETILPAVAIKSLNDCHSEDPTDNWFYDSVTPRGFAFDGAMPWASKTPFGREKTRSKPAVSLIQTPAGLAEFQRNDIALAHGYHLSSILRYVSYLTGDQTLVDDYRERIIQELGTFDDQQKTTAAVRFARAALNLAMQESFRFGDQEVTDKILDVKKAIYRFPAVAIMNLALLWNVYATSVWDVIEEMEEAGVFSKEDAHHLQVLVSISGELRLRTYLELGGQKENLSGLMAMQRQQEIGGETLLKSVFYVPDQKMLFRYHYTATPLKNNIRFGRIAVGFYDASPRVKAFICTGVLKFKAAISYTEEALRQLEDGRDAVANEYGPKWSHHLKACLLGINGANYTRLGDHRKAISCWEEQLKVQQQQLPDYDSMHAEMPRTYGNLTMACTKVEDVKRSLTYPKQMLSIVNKDIDTRDFNLPHDFLYILSKLNSILERMADNPTRVLYDHGSALLSSSEELLNVFKTFKGENFVDHENDPDIARELLFYVQGCKAIGDYTKAITYREESLEMMKNIYGQDTAHPDIAESLTILGDSLCKGRGDHVEAARRYEEALEMNKIVFGKDTPHPVTANILCSLGVERLHLGDHQKARSCLEQALQMAKSIHGDDAHHPDIARALNNLGKLWDISGDNEKALEFFEEALKMNRALHGQITPHPDTACTLAKMAPAMGKSGNIPKAIRLSGEALEMLDSLGLLDTMKSSDLALGLGNIGLACCMTGEHEKALQYCERALEICKGIHGQDAPHPSIATSLSNLAAVKLALCDYSKAIQLYEDALDMLKVIHGANGTHGGKEPRHPDIACALSNLGHVWDIAGDNKKALLFFEESLKMYQELYGPTTPHRDTARALTNMGIVQEKSGDHVKAVTLYEEALKMLEALYRSKDHPEIVSLLNKLGSACHNAGERTKAMQYCERALEMNKGIHGQDAAHPSVAASLRNLANAHKHLGNYTEAIKIYEDELNMRKTIHSSSETQSGDEACHPDIAHALNNLGLVWNITGDNEKAREFYEQSLKMYRALHGPDTPHHNTALVLENVGSTWEISGDNVKAISYYEEALKMMEDVWGKNKAHPNIAKVLRTLGLACRKEGKHTKSRRYYQRAMKINKSIHGQDAAHPSIAESLRNLANAEKDIGNYTEAIQLYEEELNMRKTIHLWSKIPSGDEVCHPDIAHALNNLGLVWSITGDNEKAREFFEQSLKMFRTLHGPDTPHHNTALVLENVGFTWGRSGDNVKAIRYYEEALKMMEEVWGKSTAHPNITKVEGSLRRAYGKAERHFPKESLRHYMLILRLNKRIHGEDAVHPSIAETLSNLAGVYEALGDHTKAIQLFQEALNMMKIIHGAKKTHPDILKIQRNLERVHKTQSAISYLFEQFRVLVKVLFYSLL